MGDWIKIKKEQLSLLLEFAGREINRAIFTSDHTITDIKTASHYLRINQKKLGLDP